jgi:hypothetical protein
MCGNQIERNIDKAIERMQPGGVSPESFAQNGRGARCSQELVRSSIARESFFAGRLGSN